MTAALERGEWSAVRPGRNLPPGKTRYPFYRKLVGAQCRSGRAENLVPTGIRFRTVQPVVSRYTDWATGPSPPYRRSSNLSCRVRLILKEIWFCAWFKIKQINKFRPIRLSQKPQQYFTLNATQLLSFCRFTAQIKLCYCVLLTTHTDVWLCLWLHT